MVTLSLYIFYIDVKPKNVLFSLSSSPAGEWRNVVEHTPTYTAKVIPIRQYYGNKCVRRRLSTYPQALLRLLFNTYYNLLKYFFNKDVKSVELYCFKRLKKSLEVANRF